MAATLGIPQAMRGPARIRDVVVGPGGASGAPPTQALSTNVTFIVTRYSVILPFSQMTF